MLWFIILIYTFSLVNYGICICVQGRHNLVYASLKTSHGMTQVSVCFVIYYGSLFRIKL